MLDVIDLHLYLSVKKAGALTQLEVEAINKSFDFQQLPQLGKYPLVVHLLHCSTVLNSYYKALKYGEHKLLKSRFSKIYWTERARVVDFCEAVKVELQRQYAHTGKSKEDMQKMVLQCQLFAFDLSQRCKQYGYIIQHNPLYTIYWELLKELREEYGIEKEEHQLEALTPTDEVERAASEKPKSLHPETAYGKFSELIEEAINGISYVTNWDHSELSLSQRQGLLRNIVRPVFELQEMAKEIAIDIKTSLIDKGKDYAHRLSTAYLDDILKLKNLISPHVSPADRLSNDALDYPVNFVSLHPGVIFFSEDVTSEYCFLIVEAKVITLYNTIKEGLERNNDHHNANKDFDKSPGNVIGVSFEEYLVPEKRHLYNSLVKEFQDAKPLRIAYMLFALKDLEALVDTTLMSNQTTLHKSLEKSFGSIGTRQSLSKNIFNLGQADSFHHTQISRIRNKIKSFDTA